MQLYRAVINFIVLVAYKIVLINQFSKELYLILKVYSLLKAIKAALTILTILVGKSLKKLILIVEKMLFVKISSLYNYRYLWTFECYFRYILFQQELKYQIEFICTKDTCYICCCQISCFFLCILSQSGILILAGT